MSKKSKKPKKPPIMKYILPSIVFGIVVFFGYNFFITDEPFLPSIDDIISQLERFEGFNYTDTDLLSPTSVILRTSERRNKVAQRYTPSGNIEVAGVQFRLQNVLVDTEDTIEVQFYKADENFNAPYEAVGGYCKVFASGIATKAYGETRYFEFDTPAKLKKGKTYFLIIAREDVGAQRSDEFLRIFVSPDYLPNYNENITDMVYTYVPENDEWAVDPPNRDLANFGVFKK